MTNELAEAIHTIREECNKNRKCEICNLCQNGKCICSDEEPANWVFEWTRKPQVIDNAIMLTKKQIETDKIQKENIKTRPKEKSLEASVKRKIDKKIEAEEYILNLLRKQQKKGEGNE